MFVIPPVVDSNITEWHIANNSVKEAVGNIGFFKRLCRNRGFLIELLCDTRRNFVDLNAVDFAVLHRLWQHTDKVSNSTGRLQDVALTESHLFHCLVN